MVSTGNHKPGVRQLCSDQVICLDHQFEAFVRSPLAEGENAVNRATAPREIRDLRTTRENSVRTQMNVVSPVFVVQDFAISRHQYRYRM